MAEDWPQPEGFDRRDRVVLRLACSAAVALVGLVVFREYVTSVLPLLWPPREPLASWAGIVLLQAFGVVLGPLMIGSFLADMLAKHYVDAE